MTQLNALIAEIEAFDNLGEVFDTLMGLRDDVRVEDAKLMRLNDFITEAEDEIEMKEAQLEVAESSCLEDKMRYVFDRSHGEDESMAQLMRDLFLSLRVSLSNKQRLVAELEAVREVEGVVKYLEHMRVTVGACSVTKARELQYLCSFSYLSLVLFNPWFSCVVYIYTLSLKLLSMAALYILDKLVEVANSSRVQDKIKDVFVQARGADESFIALMHDLCSALRVSIAKNRRLIAKLDDLGQPAEASKPLDYMKEMVVCNFATLGVLEQLLAGAHVGMRLKIIYVAAMEETE
nr:hypothetical protein [Tanacetum cinerariifolium]